MGQAEDLRTFVQIVELGSISKAADTLNVAKSAVSRRLALLEDRYQTRLIEREPGTWRLTAAGRELYQRAAIAIGEIDEIEADFTDPSQGLSGPLSLSIPREFGIRKMTGALLRFQSRYPDIQLNVDFDDRRVDLAREDYDFIVRITPNELSGFETTRIGIATHQLYASKSYLAEHGTPGNADDLTRHALLHYGPARRATWDFRLPSGASTSVEFSPHINSNTGSFLLDATLQGHGISRLPDFVVHGVAGSEALSVVLPEYIIPDWGIFLIHAPIRRLNKKMRVFTKEMLQAF